jgi:dolichol kinase
MSILEKSEIRLEFRRKFAHMILGSAIIIAAWGLEPILGKMVALPLFAAVVAISILQQERFRSHLFNRILVTFERKKDEKILYQGALFYGIGITLPLLLLDIRAASAVIAILTFGDGASTLIGKVYGKRKIWKNKSLEGFFGFLLLAIPASYIFLQSLPAAILLSLAGAIIELFSSIDDNFAIPAGLTILYLLAGLI